MANQIQNTLLLEIATNTASLKQGLAEAKSKINSFGAQIGKIGAALGGAFAVKEIFQFGAQLSQLAAEAQGVKSAFEKLPNSTQLLQDMRSATEGTIDNLKLMKLGVSAFNNNVPLENLSEILAFVDKTADATGQSFDEMAKTIISNVGKGSTKGLNELGLSIEKVKTRSEEIGFVPALMEEIRRKSEELGEISSDQGDAVDRLAASWANFRLAVGQTINENVNAVSVMDTLSGSLDVMASKNLSFWDKMGVFFGGFGGVVNAASKEVIESSRKAAEEQKKNEQVIREVDKAFVEFKGNIDAYSDAISTHILKTQLLAEFKKRLAAEEAVAAAAIENEKNLTERLNEAKEQAILLTGRARAEINREIKTLQDKIKALRELGVEEAKAGNVALTKRARIYKADLGVDATVDTSAAKVAGIDLAPAQEQAITYKDTLDQIGESLNETFAVQGVSAIDAMSSSLFDLNESQKTSFASLVMSVLQGIRKIINGLLAQAIAAAIAGESSKGLFGLATAAVAIAGITALFRKKVPKFEHGGIVDSSPFQLVGEAGAELVSLPTGSRVFNHNQTKDILRGSGTGSIIAETFLEGETLRLLLKRVENRRN